MPASWLFQYSLRNGGSVPSCCVTSYWIGVSFFFSSSSDGFLYCDIDPPLVVSLAAAMGVDCDCMQPKRRTRIVGMSLCLIETTACLPDIEPVLYVGLFDAGDTQWFQRLSGGGPSPPPA